MATETVTVVFTDLVGSTELSSRLGPAGAESLRLTHFGLLRGAIDTAGGTEVKNLGDGLMVAFTSLSRALAYAVAMQQAIERHNQRDGGEALSVRIGISTGETTEEDGDYFGEPVIEAARLCTAAAGGQILAAEIVKLIAGRHATQELVSVGDLILKGLPEAVPTVEVVWEAATTGSTGDQLPLPVRLVGASSESLFAFFGRAAELQGLMDTQKACTSEGALRVTLVSGEPGIGKTTLVAQAARAAHADGANVLFGACEEGLATPYQPWANALSQLVDHLDEAVLRDFADARGLAVANLVPDLARRLGSPVPGAGSDADAERFLLLEGAARLLTLASADAPVIVVLDDLHWVDAASVQLLRHLVTSTIPMAVHVVGTFRKSDLAPTHPLAGALAELRRDPRVERVDLVGLDDVDIIELLSAAAGHEVPDDGVALAHALRRETGGNPFFVVEVIRHLAETGAFTQDAQGQWVVAGGLEDLGLPSSVREVVAHRVARLGADTEKALSLAAVIGRDFDLELLAGLLDQDEDDLLDLLDGAMAAGLIDEPDHQLGRYRFVHTLIQHTLYQELSAARRQRAHQRIAEALEAHTASDHAQPLAELAHHWLAATRPTDGSKALHYARRAGDAALAAYAPLDAVDWYERAVELLDRQPDGDDHIRCELLVGLGTAQGLAGQPGHRDTLREAGRIALRLRDRDLLVTAALARLPVFSNSDAADPDRLAVIDAALAAVGPDDSTDRAHLLACLAEEIDPRDVDRRSQVASEAIDLAHRVGDEPTLLAVLCLCFSPLQKPDTLDQRVDESAHAIELADRLGDTAGRFQARMSRMLALAEAGDLAEYDTCLVEIEAIVTQWPAPLQRCQVHMQRAWRHLDAGRLTEAEAESVAMLELGTTMGWLAATASYGAQLVQQRLQRGTLAEIVDVVRQAVIENPTIPATRPVFMIAAIEVGHVDEASAILEAGVADDFQDMPFDMTWLSVMSMFGEVAADLGRDDVADVLYERLLPYADRFMFVGALDWGATARSLGRLATLMGRYDDAEAHLRQALDVHERMEAPYWIARTRLDQAELALTRRNPGDDEAASDLIGQALATAEQYGYGGLVPRAERLLARR